MAKRWQLSQMYGPPYIAYHFKPVIHWCQCFSLLDPNDFGRQIGRVSQFRHVSGRKWATSFTEN